MRCIVGVFVICLMPAAFAMESEEEQILCNRELCDVVCPIGHVYDTRGCPTCECLRDPCQEPGACEPGEICTVRHECTADECTHDHVIPDCQERLPCPMPMCMTDCSETGYETNEHGCMTCNCNEATPDPCEGYECPTNHECMPIPNNVPEDVRPRIEGAMRAFCLHDFHRDAFLNRFGDGSVPPEPVGEYPPGEMPGLCHLRMHHLHEMEEAMRRHGDGLHRIPYDRMGAMQENCNPDGSFKPVHCDFRTRVCWCVNDHGAMIPGTTVPMGDDDQRPQCEEHRTVTTEIVMVFNHDIEGDLREHMEPIKQVVQEKLCVWLGMDTEMVVIKEVCQYNGGPAIKVVVILKHDGESSLPYLAARLTWMIAHSNLVIEYGEYTLTPDLRAFQTNHETYPVDEIPGYFDDSDEDSDSSESDESYESGEAYSARCRRIWRAHKGLAVVAIMGGILILTVVTTLICCVCCKRRWTAKAQFNHKKMNTYKENIAYSNEVMSSHPDVTVVEKKGSRSDVYKVHLPETQEKY